MPSRPDRSARKAWASRRSSPRRPPSWPRSATRPGHGSPAFRRPRRSSAPPSWPPAADPDARGWLCSAARLVHRPSESDAAGAPQQRRRLQNRGGPAFVRVSVNRTMTEKPCMRTKLLAAPALGVAILVAACSSGSGATTAPTTAPTTAASTPPSAAPSTGAESPAGGAAGVSLADSKFGKILVDSQGRSLYIFTPDGTSGKSVCTDKCLASWPALTSDATPTLGTGLDAEDFASITRADTGAKQVTFYGMPLYYFAADKSAGDVNGQGVGGKWYVIGADGKPITTAS